MSLKCRSNLDGALENFQQILQNTVKACTPHNFVSNKGRYVTFEFKKLIAGKRWVRKDGKSLTRFRKRHY